MFGKTLLWFGVLSALIIVVHSVCPNNCSNNGRCDPASQRCVCNPSYAGEDCSYILQTISSGQTYSGHVPTFGWAYYTISVPDNIDLTWQVNQTSDGDCDLYIERDSYPTRSHYFMRDISTSSRISLDVPHASAGKWFAGVYGFIQCSFSLSVNTMSGSCGPANCNNATGKGYCGMNQQCICAPGFSGADCSQSNILVPNQKQSGTVSQYSWQYYSYNVSTVPQTLRFVLNQTVAGDADLYLNFGSVPSKNGAGHYIASNLTTQWESEIVHEALSTGEYFVGVYGYHTYNNNLTYTIMLATNSASCQQTTQCSGPAHGQCNGNSCRCNPGYNGTDCEFKFQPIREGHAETGFVTDSVWNYYTYVGLRNNEVTITVTQDSNQNRADCDIYVKGGKLPKLMDYDYTEMTQNTQFSLTIPEPQDETWYIGIYGWQACSYSMSVSTRTNRTCLNGGTWDPTIDGCICPNGWAGVFCEDRSASLSRGGMINGSVTYNQWAYYTIQVNNAHSLEVRLRENPGFNTTERGTVWLYVSQEDYPDLHNYDESDVTTDDGIHSIHISSKGQPLQGLYYIGVYGSPYGKISIPNYFSLVAWYPDF